VIHLLDVNVLIALAWPQHVHHSLAHRWFEKSGSKAWATCPLTQLAFVRISSNPKIVQTAVMPHDAALLLERIIALPNHHFWSDDVPALARAHEGRLATLDGGIAELEPNRKLRERHLTIVN
jgi:uncharacterized protein